MLDNAIIELMESIGRFEHCENEDEYNLEFWDNEYEGYHNIKKGSTLKEVLKYIIDFHVEESYNEGKQDIKREFRKLLGVSV